MKQILLIEASPQGAHSSSNKLGRAVVDKITSKHPGSKVVTRNLTDQPLPHLDPICLAGFMNTPDKHSPDEKRAIRHSDEIIAEMFAADVIIVATPMWNFSIPSVLKAYIDHLARAGKTFKYSAKGPEGLLVNKSMYLAVSSGGMYSAPPMNKYNFVVPYLTSLFGFLGITDVKTVWAEGLAMPEVKDTAVQKAIDVIKVS